jgi:hypothetical protein
MLAFSVLYGFVLLSAYRKSLFLDNEADIEATGAGTLELRAASGKDTVLDVRDSFSETVAKTNQFVKFIEDARDKGSLLSFFSEKIINGARVVTLVPFRESHPSMQKEDRFLPMVFYISGSTADGDSVFLHGTVKSLQFKAIATDIWNFSMEGADNSLTLGASSLARHIRVEADQSSVQSFGFKVSDGATPSAPFSMVHVTGFGIRMLDELPYLTADRQHVFFRTGFRPEPGGIAWMHPAYELLGRLRRSIYLNPSLRIVQVEAVEDLGRVTALSTGPVAKRFAYEIDMDPNARKNGHTLPFQLKIKDESRLSDPGVALDPRLVFGTFGVSRALFYTASRIPDAMMFSNPVLLGLSFEIVLDRSFKKKWIVMETDIQQPETAPAAPPVNNLPAMRVRWLLVDDDGTTIVYGNNTDQNSFSGFTLEFLGGLGKEGVIVPVEPSAGTQSSFVHDGLQASFSQEIHDRRHGEKPTRNTNTVFVEEDKIKSIVDLQNKTEADYTTMATIASIVVGFSILMFVFDRVPSILYSVLRSIMFLVIGALVLFSLGFVGIMLYLIYTPQLRHEQVFVDILETTVTHVFPLGLLAMFVCNAIATLAYSAQINSHISAFNLAVLVQYALMFIVLQSKQLYNSYVELEHPTLTSKTNMILLLLYSLCFAALAGGQLFRVYAIMDALAKMARHIEAGNSVPREYDWGLPFAPIETFLQFLLVGGMAGALYFAHTEKNQHLQCNDLLDDALISNALFATASKVPVEEAVVQETNKDWKEIGLGTMRNYYKKEHDAMSEKFASLECSRERPLLKVFPNGFNGMQLAAAALGIGLLIVPVAMWYIQRYIKPSGPFIRATGRLPRPTNTQVAELSDAKAMKVMINTIKRDMFSVALLCTVVVFRAAFVYHQGMLDYINPLPAPGVCSILAEQKDAFRVKFADGYTAQIEERSKQLEDAYTSIECINDLDKWLYYVLFFGCGSILAAAMMISTETPIQFVQHSATGHFVYTMILSGVTVAISLLS